MSGIINGGFKKKEEKKPLTIDEQIAQAENAQNYLAQNPFIQGRFTPTSLGIDELKLKKAQAEEKEKTLSSEERIKRRKKFRSLLTGGGGLLEPPQTAVQRLLGV